MEKEKSRTCQTCKEDKIRSKSKLLLEDVENKIEEFKNTGDTTILDHITYLVLRIKSLEKFEV